MSLIVTRGEFQHDDGEGTLNVAEGWTSTGQVRPLLFTFKDP